MSLLEALGYVGDTLAKPGRAVRGLLGGRPDEALAAIPFSDSMGLTDPSRAVHGRDLLDQLGVTDQADDGWGAALGGFGVDMATDPLTYLGGAALRYGGRALGVAPAELGAVAGSPAAADAAAGLGRADDPIARLLSPQEELAQASRGATSPWTPKSQIDLGPMEASPDLSLPGTPPPIPLRGPPQIDNLFTPDPFRTHFGADYSLNEFDPSGWGGSLANDALSDGRPHKALQLSLSHWDTVASDLERLSPQARAQLLGNGAESAGNQEWQALLHGRRGDLEAAHVMAAHGIIPHEYADLAAQQAARLAPFSTWSTDSHAATNLMRDLAGGMYQPRAAVEHFRDTVPYLPFDESQVRRAAALAQEEGMRQGIPRQIGSVAGEGEITPALVDSLANAYEPDYLIRQLDHLISPQAWTELEYVEPNIARRVLGEGADQSQTGALVDALRRLMADSRSARATGAGRWPGAADELFDL